MPNYPEELFAVALELTNSADRAPLLDRGNPALPPEVESLWPRTSKRTFLNQRGENRAPAKLAQILMLHHTHLVRVHNDEIGPLLRRNRRHARLRQAKSAS